MIDTGDVHLADIGRETRATVLVVSNRRFHTASRRALVCPLIETKVEEPFPWWIETDHGAFAVDRLVTLPTDRVLERRGRISAVDVGRVRRALAAIT